MDIKKIIVPSLIIVILVGIVWFKFSSKEETLMPHKELPEEKEFVWVCKDSLSRGLKNLSKENIEIESSNGIYRIKYDKSKQYLFDEGTEGIITNSDYFLKKYKDNNIYKEIDKKVIITLKMEDGYVYCPVLILDRVLYGITISQSEKIKK